jgi:type II secretory pathway pseudopilin PulG
VDGAAGFTVLELLLVMGILVALAGFAVVGISGAKQRTAIARAKGELALLAQALEDYKRHYGDYPETGPSAANAQRVTVGANGLSAGPGLATTPARLLNALIGVYGPANFTNRVNGPTLVDVTRLTLEIPFSSAALTTSNLMTTFAVPVGSPPAKPAANNSFVDPWGNRYLYFYKASATARWNASSYVLYSTGPDGASTIRPDATGLFSGVTQTTGDNADNLYADKLP